MEGRFIADRDGIVCCVGFSLIFQAKRGWADSDLSTSKHMDVLSVMQLLF